ncbi:hypothetical protein HDU84_004631 [Entophlyctis sp. JEL0112]|nr:hypothetical protein HDU84_004631 [Entophlyctis sp. JEL0112]
MASYAHSIVLIGTNGGHYNLNLAADQLQIAISCMYVYQASNNDTCFSVAYAFEMSTSVLAQMNPRSSCASGNNLQLEAGDLICVSSPPTVDDGSASSTAVSATATAHASGTSGAADLPVWITSPVSVSSAVQTASSTAASSTTTTTSTTTTEESTTTTTTSTTTSTTTTSTTTTTTEWVAATTAADSGSGSNSGSGTYNIMFTYYGNGEYTDPSAFMCGKSGYASQMPSDPTQIIAISQQLGLKLFSSYMTSDEINNFESFAGPMCMSQLEITAGGTTFTKVIYDVCDDTNGCATNDIDFWDPSGVDAVCSGASGACHTSAYLNPIWMG